MLRDWFTLFVAGVPLTRVSIDTPHASEEPPPAEEAPEALLHEQEVDAYLIARADWDVTTLAKHAVPAEVLEMADHSLAEEAELTPAAAEGGCALVGRMVLDLIEVTTPPPPPKPPPVVGPSLTKIALTPTLTLTPTLSLTCELQKSTRRPRRGLPPSSGAPSSSSIAET